MGQFWNSASSRLIIKLLLTTALCSLITACSAQSEKSSTNNAAITPTTSATENRAQATAAASKLDACVLVPKSKVEAVIGGPVKSAELNRVTEGTADTAAFSECTYKLDGPQSVSIFMRRSPIADNTPEAIDRIKKTMKDVTGKESVDVKDIGDTAFWTTTKQLHVFQGGNIYVYVTMFGFKDDAQAQAKAIELARQALATLPK